MVRGRLDKSGASLKACFGMQAQIYSATLNKRILINGSYSDDGFGNLARRPCNGSFGGIDDLGKSIYSGGL